MSHNSFPHIADKIITDQSLCEELVKYSIKTMSGACEMNNSKKKEKKRRTSVQRQVSEVCFARETRPKNRVNSPYESAVLCSIGHVFSLCNGTLTKLAQTPTLKENHYEHVHSGRRRKRRRHSEVYRDVT